MAGSNFGVTSETRQTIAPVTLFEGSPVQLTIEFLGEVALRAVATGLPSGAWVQYGPPDGSGEAPIIRITQGPPGSRPISYDLPDLVGRGGLVFTVPGVAEIIVGEAPRPIAGRPGRGPTSAGDGAEASAAVDVVRVKLLPGTIELIDLRIGHMEVSAQVAPGGTSCPVPVTMTTELRPQGGDREFDTTATVRNPFACDLTNVTAEEEITAPGGSPTKILTRSDDGATATIFPSPASSGTFVIWNLDSIPAESSRTLLVGFTVDQSPGAIRDRLHVRGTCLLGTQGGPPAISAAVEGLGQTEIPSLGGSLLSGTGSHGGSSVASRRSSVASSPGSASSPGESASPAPSPNGTLSPGSAVGAGTLSNVAGKTAGKAPHGSQPVLRSRFVAAVRDPTKVETDPLVVGRNALLAALLTLILVFPSQLFNSTLEENHDVIRGWFGVAPRGKGGGKVLRWFSRSWVGFTAMSLSVGVVYGFLSPDFRFDRASLALIMGFCAAIVALTLTCELGAGRYVENQLGKSFYLRVFPVSLFVAAICIVISRGVDFQPVYMYALVAAGAFRGGLPKATAGRAVAIGSALLLALALSAWVAWIPIRQAADLPGAGLGIRAAEAMVVTIFVAGIESVLIGLVPLRFLDGHTLIKWNRTLWALLFGVSMFAFIHVVLDPATGYIGRSDRPSYVALALFIGFGLFSIAFWAFFRFRPAAETSEAYLKV